MNICLPFGCKNHYRAEEKNFFDQKKKSSPESFDKMRTLTEVKIFYNPTGFRSTIRKLSRQDHLCGGCPATKPKSTHWMKSPATVWMNRIE